ncbi:MAG: apolipoprotein N-acyltransferase [Phycisphaerales bacterium]|jgi:apolipoprotein N-acyltransferase|nr:apolipoprotein N-acyltransferase [Phycisphaerales bacterium]
MPGTKRRQGVLARIAPAFARGLCAGLVHSLLMLGAFPTLGLWGAAFVAITPLVWISRARVGVWTFLGLALGSAPFWAIVHLWLADVTLPGLIGMVPILAAMPAIYAWLLARLRERALSRVGEPGVRAFACVIVGAVLWTGMEVFRGEVMAYGYPWYLIGQPLIDAPSLTHPASFGSVYLVSLLVAIVNCAGVECVLVARASRRASPLGRPVFALGPLFGPVLAIMLVAGGWYRAWSASPQLPEDPDAPRVRIGIVQTNLPQDNKLGWELDDRVQRLDDWLALSERCVEQGAELIVWPETMYPGFVLEESGRNAVSRDAEAARASKGENAVEVRFERVVDAFAERFLTAQAGMGVPIVVGAPGFDGLRIGELPDGGLDLAFDATFNSGMLVRDGRVEPVRYDKLHLTPFGEVMPYISEWPWLEKQLLAIGARGMSFELSRGTGAVRWDAAGLRLGAIICFEGTMPGVCRTQAYDGGRPAVDALVSLTNDGWFGASDMTRRMHLMATRWRCVELGVPIVRAANTGISCLIGADGQPQATPSDLAADASNARREGTLIVDVYTSPPGEPGTWFGRHGMIVPMWTMALAGVLTLAGLFTPARDARAGDSGDANGEASESN